MSCTRITPSGIEATMTTAIDGSFDRIEIIGPFVVQTSPLNKSGEAEITADSNLLPQIQVLNRGNTLVIRYKKHAVWKENKARIKLPAGQSLVEVNVSSDGHYVYDGVLNLSANLDIKASGASYVDFKNVAAKDMRIELSGASSFKGEVNAVNLSLSLSGASVFNASGNAVDCAAEISGASVLEGRDLIDRFSFSVQNFSGLVSGASSAFFSCNGNISGTVSGASKIVYKGNANTSGVILSGGSTISAE